MDLLTDFEPPEFRPHLIFRGGHLQTIVSLGFQPAADLHPQTHTVEVSDGDAIVLHCDRPLNWRPSDPSMLLIHGLTGCHGAPYMIRLAEAFLSMGMCVFRMDMRGCGAASELAKNVTHAGRSEDVMAAFAAMSEITQADAGGDAELRRGEGSQPGPLHAVAMSMGANQLLRGLGRVGAGLDPRPNWFDRLGRIAAVAPPLDLQRCADNMQRFTMRPYNYYFIRSLISRVPPGVRRSDAYQKLIRGRRPSTLKELDDRFTAPLSGYEGAEDYYHQASAMHVTPHIPCPALVLASADDPIVPVGCFVDDDRQWSKQTRLIVTHTGGHVGFIDRDRNCWMDDVLKAWFEAEPCSP